MEGPGIDTIQKCKLSERQHAGKKEQDEKLQPEDQWSCKRSPET